MTETQFRILTHLIAFLGVALIFAVRAVSEAVTGDDTWRVIYGLGSLVAWVWAVWGWRYV